MVSEVLVSLRDVSVAFAGHQVLANASLEIYDGEFLGVVGPNGSGKTTLLRIILGLVQPDQGSVQILGQAPGIATGSIGYVAQFASFRRNFPISVQQTVLQGRLGLTRPVGRYRAADREAAREALQQVAAWNLRDKPIGVLSGGQLQRVLIARALAGQPRILLLDEPTSNVDMAAEEGIFGLLKELSQSMAIVLVSHDVGFVSEYVARVACVNEGIVVHPTAEITPEVLQSLYGHGVHVIDHHAADGQHK
ncbi:MAG: metal ABC transporter ATP-binding protein [Gammaproteobacteria bacterium]|nr:metal ABC transporter ATP-binding protein [Gammaproteobacteria bacterium]